MSEIEIADITDLIKNIKDIEKEYKIGAYILTSKELKELAGICTKGWYDKYDNFPSDVTKHIALNQKRIRQIRQTGVLKIEKSSLRRLYQRKIESIKYSNKFRRKLGKHDSEVKRKRKLNWETAHLKIDNPIDKNNIDINNAKGENDQLKTHHVLYDLYVKLVNEDKRNSKNNIVLCDKWRDSFTLFAIDVGALFPEKKLTGYAAYKQVYKDYFLTVHKTADKQTVNKVVWRKQEYKNQGTVKYKTNKSQIVMETRNEKSGHFNQRAYTQENLANKSKLKPGSVKRRLTFLPVEQAVKPGNTKLLLIEISGICASLDFWAFVTGRSRRVIEREILTKNFSVEETIINRCENEEAKIKLQNYHIEINQPSEFSVGKDRWRDRIKKWRTEYRKFKNKQKGMSKYMGTDKLNFLLDVYMVGYKRQVADSASHLLYRRLYRDEDKTKVCTINPWGTEGEKYKAAKLEFEKEKKRRDRNRVSKKPGPKKKLGRPVKHKKDKEEDLLKALKLI